MDERLRSGLRALLVTGALGAIAACTGNPLPAAPDPSGTGTPSSTAVSFKSDVAPLLVSSCRGCHAAGQDGARDLLIFDGSGAVSYEAVKADIRQIVTSVQRGKMPQRGPKLTTQQVGILSAWQQAGTPDN